MCFASAPSGSAAPTTGSDTPPAPSKPVAAATTPGNTGSQQLPKTRYDRSTEADLKGGSGINM